MGTIKIQRETITDPISLIGREAGICWNADIENVEKNRKRGIECLNSRHGRTWEYPQVFMVIDGYSARVIRELYTHIGGNPTRLQASTRYVNYQDFEYVLPPKIAEDETAKIVYETCFKEISLSMQKLETLNIPREDIGMLLPLGMKSTIVVRTNLRNLIDMAHQRMCTRAYWEFRQMMEDIKQALSSYSDEWTYVTEHFFLPKCKEAGFCYEKKSCGKMPKRIS
jgi:thymidylate synthase (FAD)